MRVFYSPDYVVEDFGLETVTKSRLVAQKLSNDDRFTLEDPTPVTRDELVGVHDSDYVDAVLTGEPYHLACGGLGRWSEAVSRSVSSTTGGMRDAALAALRDGTSASLSSGLHHARRSRGSGFCTFNGLAVAALAAIKAGVASVGVLDLDAHGGGGTHELLGEHPRVSLVDVSVCSFDRWVPSAERHHYWLVSDSSTYLEAVADALDALGNVELVLYNAGVDVLQGCDTGGLAGIDQEMVRARDEMVARRLGELDVPVAVTLAGGYRGSGCSLDQVIDTHVATLGMFATG